MLAMMNAKTLIALALPVTLAAPAALAYAQDNKAAPVVDIKPAAPSTSRSLDELRDADATSRRAAEARDKRDRARGAKAKSTSSPAPAATPRLAQADAPKPRGCRRPKGRFSFNADKEDIHSLLKRISQITCKNFIVSESVKGKSDITIISHRPVTSYQAEAAFLAALQANNMALVPAGAYWKVVERKDAAKQALPMYESLDDLPSTDAQVTLLYELKYAGKDQVQPLLRNLMSKSGDLQTVGGSLLIVTDAASNIQRLAKILEKIDVSGSSSRMHIVDVQWADAQQISQKLQEIFKDATPKGRKASKGAAGGGGGDDVSIDKIIADERTNKLIIIGSLAGFESLKEVIDLLDVPGDDRSTGTRVYVHPLNNADAQKTASTLSSLTQGAGKKPNKGKKGAAGSQAAELFEGEVKITADESTNALVIISSPRDYKALKDVIAELDVRRPQVFVEAAIMEVAMNESRRVSVDAYSGLPVTVPGFDDPGLGIIANEGGKNLVVSSAQALAAQSLFQSFQNQTTIDATQISAAVDASTALESLIGVIGFQGPAIPETQEAFGFAVPSFGVVLNALQSNANVNVLSTPHIMTTDNEKAEISVGERIPVVRGISPVSGGGAGGLFGGLQQVAYEDVKLKFTVTPHVNDSGEIRVESEQEVSDLGGNVPVGNGLEQPIITNRSAKTTVVVRDQQTVVIGGLVSDRDTDSESKIPILGDIPLIGWLFKNWSDSKSKTNLILVLTPYVVYSQTDFQKIYQRKMRDRKDFLEAYYGVGKDYNPYIDYDKKTGPVGQLIGTIDHELLRVENGGPGLPGEVVITPEAELTPISEDGDADDEGGDADDGGETAPPDTGDAPPVPDAADADAPPAGDEGDGGEG
jgi:general secretion pathway protein D